MIYLSRADPARRAELSSYALDRGFAADVALANHLVMGPAIVKRALAGTGVRYAVKVHGSALEYTVKPHPRFLPYDREGIQEANTVLLGSRHAAQRACGRRCRSQG